MKSLTLVVDTESSWMNEYVPKFLDSIKKAGWSVQFCRNSKDIPSGDVALFLGCVKIVPALILKRNKHNLVAHESDLPKGKGWSPLTWQILEGKNKIPVSLFEALEGVDSGPVYFKEFLSFEGHELIGEMREKLADLTLKLILKFLKAYPNVRGEPQKGEESFYKRRTPADSELDLGKPLKDQFNLLRVVDNERYPAFFTLNGKKYLLKISKAE